MRMSVRATVVAACLAGVLALAGCTTDAPVTSSIPAQTTTTPSGLRYADTLPGTGASPRRGQTAVVHYTGWLDENGIKGKKFDSSVDRGKPFEFKPGQGQVIKGWDEGVATMKVGGKRTLIVPAQLGYGAQGSGSDIPPNSTLIFEVELIAVK